MDVSCAVTLIASMASGMIPIDNRTTGKFGKFIFGE